VFAGGFSLDAAAAVCCGGDQAAALEAVEALAAKSLVVADISQAATRYRLLETIRQYAAGHLAEAGQARQRHAAAFLRIAERETGLSSLAGEHDNFRAALGWSLSSGDETGPPLARALRLLAGTRFLPGRTRLAGARARRF
jgi:predicted ATPase